METRSQDTPTATIYHHSIPMAMSAAAMSASAQPQLICFSPPVQQVAPLEAFGHTQRKMLLDPSTGSYYLVDTPVPPPTTRRLFDPETGQYVDVPLPAAAHPPPPQPMTPVPLPLSPLAALSPGAYAHGVPYVFYPGFMPSPTLVPARMQSQASLQGSDGGPEGRDKVGLPGDEGYMEGPYYMATGGARGPQQQHLGGAGGGTKVMGGGGKQPLISITSQQGPRIIAPPSFDGTTMSFVVEHR